jgi:bifunctional ADP-heptose synthase (sugar kinase/adenylyltransferase)
MTLELLLALGRRAEASTLVQQLADRAPERWELRLLLAELRRDLGDRSGAIAVLRRLLAQKPDQIEALNPMPKDVAGAGDSMLIASGMALAVGANIWEAACLGSIAAAIQVGRVGNTPISLAEMRAALTS